jgi:hypothetical protein
VIIGGLSYFMVHDFPDDARFLSEPDRQRVIRRLKADKQSSAEHEEFKMSYFWASVKDWKTWAFAVVYMGCDGPLYAFSLFLPTIVEGARLREHDRKPALRPALRCGCDLDCVHRMACRPH